VGELEPARAHLEEMIAFYDPQQHHALAFRYGTDPGVVCLSWAALALWLLGYPDQALARSHAALALAREVSHPFSLAFALFFNAKLHQLRHEEQATQVLAEDVLTLATACGFPFWMAYGTVWKGWALAAQGQRQAGIAQMQQRRADFRTTLFQTVCLALLAEAYGNVGRTGEGLTLLGEALAVVQESGERFYEAELCRLRGVFMLAQQGTQDNREEATTCFQQALAIARRQQAKSWELRAAMSLSRLWQHQGKRDEARQLLAPIYGWFTEGFDTADLQEAKALLEELP
jgi:predicted ATPase